MKKDNETNIKPDTKARQGSLRKAMHWPVAFLNIAAKKKTQAETTN